MISIRRLAPKFITLVLVFVFASLLFVGCGGDTTAAPTTGAPITTLAPTTQAPTTQAPTTQAPTTQAPTTQAPTTLMPTTQAPTTESPTTIPEPIAVSSITVTGAEESTTITSFQGTLQMSALVLPADAEDKSVVWTVVNGTGAATISETGLLTAVANGIVNVEATSVSTPAISGSLVITISNQEVLVTTITVSGAGDSSVISTFQGTLQMSALVLPAEADDKSVIWTVVNGTGEATISETGLLTAVADGTVLVKATSVSTPDVFGSKVITISNQEVLVASISVSGAGDSSVISTFQGTLQMSALVLPANAEDKSVVWTVANGTGEATISETGLLTAVSDGTVTVTATSVSTPTVFGTKTITISNQEVLVASIEVTGAEDSTEITTFHGTLQMSALVLPANAEDKSVVWTVVNGTGEATINGTGLLTAVADGTVTVTATSVSTPDVSGSLEITISNQEVLVTSITVNGTDGISMIDVTDGTLQMVVLVLPEDADDKSVVWTLANGTGMGTISETGLLTAVADGTVTVTATSVSTPTISGSVVITISNQVVVAPIANVDLGLAGDFVILSKAGISTTGTTLITGNIGVSPVAATYITGFDLILDSTTQFSTSSLVVGNIYASDYSEPTPSYLTTAISNMEAAYTDAASRAANYTELYAGDISGQTLYTGVYKYGTDLLINTDVTLSGSATDVFIFQVSGKLNLANGIHIILEDGALAENIVWQVAGTVSIGTGSFFAGTVLAQTDITVATNATVSGKLYAQTEVTLDANIIG